MSLNCIITILFVALTLSNVHCSYNEEDGVFNNEIFPRYSKFGSFHDYLASQEMESRQLLGPINQNSQQGLFSRNPFLAFLMNRLPFIRNPDFTSLVSTYDSCKAPGGEFGICLGAPACTLLGGQASGSCNLASVCCINSLEKCSGTITLNNTYWKSPPAAVSPQSSCSVAIRLDQKLPEQKKQPICQVRLDFISFTIAQPTKSVCDKDTFQASGGSNKLPVICGDNNEQHMYVHVPSSAMKATDVQLTFGFGSGVTPRNWNIKISMIPCGATYAAPVDCLQYYTGSSGTVKSFNWIDTAIKSVRQLANQEYSICFRNELINAQRATSVCFQTCAVINGGDPFRLSGNNNNAASGTTCLDDFLVMLNAQNTITQSYADRYCGGSLSNQICSIARPFKIYYRTNGDELDPATEAENVGFCLTYTQRRA